MWLRADWAGTNPGVQLQGLRQCMRGGRAPDIRVGHLQLGLMLGSPETWSPTRMDPHSAQEARQHWGWRWV